jgi:hypothetical protein
MKITKMDKLKVFEQELEYIVNPDIRKFAEKAVETLPDYFFSIPASSTGKYHPTYSLGEGGLVRHVRAAIRIMVELFRMNMFSYFTSDEKDLLIVALLLHDGAKSGIPKQNYSVAEHPLIIADYINNNPDLHGIISEEYLELMLSGIRSHMGQWNMTYDASKREVLPKPISKFQNMVHLVDYLGSRKCLEMNFDVKVER